MKQVINQYINSFYSKPYIPRPVRNIYFYWTYILISLPRWNSCISNPFQKECLSLSYSLVGMKLAQLLSCRVLTPTCLVDQMDLVSREKFFQASVEHLCRSTNTVVSIYHSRFVCFCSSTGNYESD